MSDDLKPEAWLVIHKQTKKRRVIDAAKHDPSSLVFWVSQEAADMHNIVPLYGRALPAVSPGVTPEAETERVFMDAVWDATGFRGTPEQLINALSEMVRREPRQMQGAILRAALSALTAANARADALEQQVADLLADVPCACGYDNPDDVCMKHLPLFRRLKAQLADAEPKALRAAADMVASTAYTSNGDGRSLEPVSAGLVGMDMHHATIAEAILALIPKGGAK